MQHIIKNKFCCKKKGAPSHSHTNRFWIRGFTDALWDMCIKFTYRLFYNALKIAWYQSKE